MVAYKLWLDYVLIIDINCHCSMLQQLQKDQMQAVTPDKSQFRSLNDAVQRLLSYHVCQGSLPTEEDLRKGNFHLLNWH